MDKKMLELYSDFLIASIYLVSNDDTLNYNNVIDLYHKRWKIKEHHKSMKQNASLEKSPTKVVRTQSNHIFASVYAYVKLELLRVKTTLNHFALKSKIYIKALRNAMNEIYMLRHQNLLVGAQGELITFKGVFR